MSASASAVAVAARSGSKPETTSLTTPLSLSSAAGGYFSFAATEGYYDKYGLSVSAPASDSTQVKAAVAAGSTPVSGLGVIDTLNLVSVVIPIKIIGCQQLTVPFQVWAKNDIKSPKDLKGKSLGITNATGAFYVSNAKFLEANKLSTDDVSFVPLGSVPNVMAALVSDRIDAALLSYPFYQTAAQDGGLHKIGDAPSPPNVVGVDAEWAKKNRNTILAYLKGNTEGLAAYSTERAKALPVLAKFLRLNLDDPTQGATVQEGYRIYRSAYTPLRACDKTLFDSYIPFLTPEEQAKLSKPNKLLDTSYVQQLVDEGFYAKITKKYGPIQGIPE